MRDGLKCRPGARRLPGWRGEAMRRLAAAVVVGWLTVLPAAAEPLAREQVPEALRPWTDWVMHGHEEAFCSLLHGSTDHRQCAWPSRLMLDLDGRAAASPRTGSCSAWAGFRCRAMRRGRRSTCGPTASRRP